MYVLSDTAYLYLRKILISYSDTEELSKPKLIKFMEIIKLSKYCGFILILEILCIYLFINLRAYSLIDKNENLQRCAHYPKH